MKTNSYVTQTAAIYILTQYMDPSPSFPNLTAIEGIPIPTGGTRRRSELGRERREAPHRAILVPERAIRVTLNGAQGRVILLLGALTAQARGAVERHGDQEKEVESGDDRGNHRCYGAASGAGSGV